MNTNSTIIDAITALRDGRIGIMPTDTVYGVVARAADKLAVQRLYALKSRERKPGTLIAANVDQLVRLGLAAGDLEIASQWWPNPLSIVLPAGSDLAYLHDGAVSLAVRVPVAAWLHDILEQTGPLVTSSANLPGEPISTDIAEAKAYFGEQVDFYLDGGVQEVVSSTVARLTGSKLEILRQGIYHLDPADLA